MAVRVVKTVIISMAQENVGRSTELNSICDARLNYIVNDLFENYVWRSNQKVSSPITLTSGSPNFTVPTDYIKGDVFKLLLPNTSPQAEKELPIYFLEDYAKFSVPTVPGEPQLVVITRTFDATGAIVMSGYVYPQPDQTFTGKLYYHFGQTYDIADGDAPGFFSIKTLVDLLTNELKGMGYGKEIPPPYDPFLIEKIVRRMRQNEADLGIYPMRARLDGKIFGRRGRNIWPADRGN